MLERTEKSRETAGLSVRVLDSAEAVADACYDALEEALSRLEHPVVSFATGNTFQGMFARVTAAVAGGRLSLLTMLGTHLDEYLGFDGERGGGMLHELVTACPPLAAALAEGRFWPVPASGLDAALAAHERRIAAHGGIALQFLGLGRNGHIAFNEPGTSFDLGFHRTRLAATTREDARARFVPFEPPTEAITAGPRTILAARRIVLAATGAAKAAAVRDMLEGPIDVACPASCLRRHGDVTVLLDGAAASGL